MTRFARPTAIMIIVTTLILGFAIGGLCTQALMQPRLVGYGCDDATGARYANEEDDLGRCDLITRR